jgi:hypothetical protein
MENDVSNWSITNSAGLSTGAWERVDPNGTIFNSVMAAPEDDATGGAQNVLCFVTQNGEVGGSAGSADVDGGSTTLVSPVLDVAGTNGVISYARWFFDSQNSDALSTYISNDNGSTWTFVHQTNSTNSSWETVQFTISHFILPTSQMRVAFIAEDNSPASVVEAGIDNFQLELIVCSTACAGDLNNDGSVSVSDLLEIIAAWGSSDPAADLNGDGTVAVSDLLIAIGNWGICP